jgi:hypothetical protein
VLLKTKWTILWLYHMVTTKYFFNETMKMPALYYKKCRSTC